MKHLQERSHLFHSEKTSKPSNGNASKGSRTTGIPQQPKNFFEELRAVLIPEKKWHYFFHFVVMLVAAAYWMGSLVKWPDATMAEIAMYRPGGDNELYPVITALSRFNFGDPTDALHYGAGTAASQVVILFPYVLAYIFLGLGGYVLADVLLAWLYFVAVAILLRRCQFGNFLSLLVSSALATRSLQGLCAKVGQSFNTIFSVFSSGTWEWGFPDLLDMQLVSGRIPRPIVTGIFVVLLLYFLIRQWQERTLPSFKRGFAMGALMALLLQGDPFSLSALGLVLLWVMGFTVAANSWRIPWRFLWGSIVGTLSFGAYFLWQRIGEHPDSAVRFGMAEFPRNHLLFLPGYAPLLRVGVVCFLAALVMLAARRVRKSQTEDLNQTHSESKKNIRKEILSKPSLVLNSLSGNNTGVEISVATFCIVLVIAAWLAQPVQLFLLGKGCQIYHYLIFTLPSLYSYGVVILFFTFLRLAMPPELPQLVQQFLRRPYWPGAILLSLIFISQAFIGMEGKLLAITSLASARQDANTPWASTGNVYRPCFRALEKEFRENPELKNVRTFATFCYEVNFLLAGFYDKRAYLPDNAYSTLSDAELEERFLEVMKIVQIAPENLEMFMQLNFVLNYWLGCAKYWMTSDHQYSTRDNYTAEEWTELQKQTKQAPWVLCLPKSEVKRLLKKYEDIVNRESEFKTYPDALIMGLETRVGLIPTSYLYKEVYTNELFAVYVKKPKPDFSQPPTTPPTPAIED